MDSPQIRDKFADLEDIKQDIAQFLEESRHLAKLFTKLTTTCSRIQEKLNNIETSWHNGEEGATNISKKSEAECNNTTITTSNGHLENVKTENVRMEKNEDNSVDMESFLSSAIKSYHTIMEENVKGKSLHPIQLSKLHFSCVEELQKSLPNCHISQRNERQDLSQKLKAELEREFVSYTTENEMLLGQIQLKVNQISRKSRMEYNEEISRHLSLIPTQLAEKNKEVSELYLKLFQMELKNMEWKHLQLDPVNLLKQEIEEDWLELKKQCNTHFTKETTDPYLKKKGKIRESGPEKKAHRKQKKETTFPSSPIKTPASQKKSSTTKQELPTIALEFAYSVVRTGYMRNGKFQIILNKWGESSTPTVLRISNTGKEKCIGNEIISEPHSLISIGDLLRQRDPSKKDRYPQRTEYYVAIFLSQVKMDVEAQLNGRWTKAVITVPLSSTSIQRKVMKDSAAFAGFQNVTLLNDTTAAALAFDKSGIVKPCLTLIGIVGGEYYDAALYEFQEGNAEMLSCWGSQHCYKKPSSCSSQKMTFRRFFGDGRLADYFKEMLGTNMRNVKTNLSIEYAQNSQTTSAFHIFGENFVPSNDTFVVEGAAYFTETDSPVYTNMFPYTFIRHNPKQVLLFTCPVFKENKIEIKSTNIMGTNSLGTTNPLIRVSEFSFLNSQEFVGDYFIKIDLAHVSQNGELRIEFVLSNEGIFDTRTVSITDERNTVGLKFAMLSKNLDKEEFKELKDLLASLIRDEEKEAFNEVKNDIMELQTMIMKELGKGNISGFGKLLLQKEVDSVATLINNKATTKEILEKKMLLIRGLKDKFIR